MKTIMILGGGTTQLPLIESAKNEGYKVVLCDYIEEVPGKKFADVFCKVSTTDKEQLLEVARRECIDGVVSNSERAMIVVAYISEQMHLVGNSELSVKTLNSKSMFREAQNRAGLFAPKHYISDDFVKIENSVKKMKFPIVVKPCESSGTRGTTRFDSFEVNSIRGAFDECIKYSRNDKAQAEEYINMPSLTVIEGDLFVNGDKVLWDGLFFTNRSEYAPMVPMTYCLPLEADQKHREMIKADLSKLIIEVGISWGAYNVEMYFTSEDQLFVIEINARQGGFRIPQIIKKHNGVDMYRLLVTTAVGDNTYFDEVYRNETKGIYNSQCVVFSHIDGVYKDLFIDKSIIPYVDSIDMKVQEGSLVRKCSNTDDAIGFVCLIFPDFETQHAICDTIEDYIYPIVEV